MSQNRIEKYSTCDPAFVAFVASEYLQNTSSYNKGTLLYLHLYLQARDDGVRGGNGGDDVPRGTLGLVQALHRDLRSKHPRVTGTHGHNRVVILLS